ncbi:hypothetical protein [Nitratireductor basaltis]|uniref:Uncharacterized protein n=1 Tax=Nitratireductor basaltis TaxID=472175 RepID=A0A084UC07_9HYPH|nr:hypothetical protein [Nitratireductor basaltis]KFB10493.1 hypothetical protein EL18_01528 [Nitratireductor basaltis]
MKLITIAFPGVVCVFSTVAFAQSSIRSADDTYLIDSYSAFIGERDLHNSSGERLTQPWQIIRQDRANYHRFGRRDSLDQTDSFFHSASNRAILEMMLRRGKISPQAAREILSGSTFVLVEIYGRGNRGEYVTVTTSR